MEYLVISYSVFTLTTTLLVLLTMFIPIVRELYEIEPKPTIVKEGNKFLIYTALIVIAIITAPVLFIVWIFPNYSKRFTEALLADLKKT